MRNKLYLLLVLLIVIPSVCGCQSRTDDRGYIMDPQNTYLVLFEMNHYPDGYSCLDNDFLNVSQIESEFISLKTPPENIYKVTDSLSQSELESAFEWINNHAKQDALILTYVGSHGRYLKNEVKWADFFPALWATLEQENKILIVDSCNSGQFTKAFEEDQSSGITYGVVAANELNWWGDEWDARPDFVPIIGGIWVHYFIEALNDYSSDINGDHAISFNEIHLYANSRTQEYMALNIFSNPEYLEMYENAGYFPTRKDTYPNAVMYDHASQPIILATYD